MNPPDPARLRETLKHVIDPENGINIVDLGLVYDIRLDGESVRITMTMTSPACPMGDMIMDDVYRVLSAVLPEGWLPDIELVWDPPWEPSMMSEAARTRLGW